MGTQFDWVDAIGVGTIFAFGMLWLLYSNRQKTGELRRQTTLFWGRWEYVFVVLASVLVGTMYGSRDQRLHQELFVATLVLLAPLAITRFILWRRLRRTNANSSSS
ncbi:MAG: hypothetical protein WB559_16905 [Candidatus Acidiferrales bacterium]